MNNATKINNYNSNKYFLIAFGLLNILAFTLLFCGLSFLAGFSISKWQFPLACVFALAGNYYASGFFMGEKAKSFFFKSSSVIAAIVICFIVLAGLIYDVSYDGQWYHQETVYQLKQGYNPVYQNLAVPQDESFGSELLWCTGVDKPFSTAPVTNTPYVNLKYLAINNFCKGSEFLEATIYTLTNHIETGKAVNGILLMASFFLCLSLFYKIDQISTRKKWIFAILLSFNPIAIVQLFTFCVDGNVAALLLCLFVIGGLLFIELNNYYLYLFASVIILAVNIKFTSLVFAGMFCIGFLVIYFIYKKQAILKKVIITGSVAACIGIVCCGFNPYLTNIIQKHNVFYGVADVEVQTQKLTPHLLRDCNRFEKLIFSLSAHEGFFAAEKTSLWHIPKIPFTFNKQDITEAQEAEQSLAGFGPFFSGVLLVAAVLFAFALIRNRKTQVFKLVLGIILIIVSTIVVTPYSWWARYIPQFWVIPIVIVCITEFIPITRNNLLKNILYLSIWLNVGWGMLSIVFNVCSTVRVNYQMAQLKAIGMPINVEYCSYERFKSNRVRFLEFDIPTVTKDVTGSNVYNIINSNTRVETPVPLPQLPKSLLLRFSERLAGDQ